MGDIDKVNKAIVIHDASTETRIALLEDDALVELYVERPENERMVGDIYKGRVENVVEAVQAAFVNIGLKQNGFLPFDDIGDQVFEFSSLSETISDSQKSKRPRRKPLAKQPKVQLKQGQTILVQVTKEPIGNKGARLTTAIALPGRFLVLVPNSNTVGISRKIIDKKERRRLRVLAQSLQPQGFGLIIRTVAVGKEVQVLRSDLDNLLRIWKRIEEKAKSEKGALLIHKDMGITSSVIRDLFSPDINRLIVDSRRLYNEIKKYLNVVAPNLINKLEYYQAKAPIFDAFHIEEEIEKSLSRKIWIKKGSHIIFDQVEAMVVVDVNSGRSVGQKDHELNALETDFAAAKEIARQLRLRDIGGIIVIDFIDLTVDKHRKKLFSAFKKELNKDRAAFDLLPMNDFGLVCLTRERVRPSLLYRYSEPCPRCNGLGRIPAKTTMITKIETRLQKLKSMSNHRRFILHARPELASYLQEGFYNRIRRLMLKYFCTIKIVEDPELRDEDFTLKTLKSEKNNQ